MSTLGQWQGEWHGEWHGPVQAAAAGAMSCYVTCSSTLIGTLTGDLSPIEPVADDLQLVHGWIGDKRKRGNYDFLNPEFHQRQNEDQTAEVSREEVSNPEPASELSDSVIGSHVPVSGGLVKTAPSYDYESVAIQQIISAATIAAMRQNRSIIEDDDDAIVHLLFEMV